MPESLRNFIKKETLAQVSSCEFCEIFKNNFDTEHLSTTASDYSYLRKGFQIFYDGNATPGAATYVTNISGKPFSQ